MLSSNTETQPGAYMEATTTSGTTTSALATQLLLNLQKQPQHPAVIFRDQTLLNRHLLYKAYRLVIAFRGYGIKRGDHVGVLMDRGPEVLVAMLAIWHCGAVYVPIDPDLPRERQLHMGNMASLRFMVTQEQRVEQAERLPYTLLIVRPLSQEDLGIPTPRDLLDTAAKKLQTSAPAYILFTSGSTGEPKGVVLSHGNLNNLFGSVAAVLQLEPGWRYLGCASLGFDIALFELMAPLLCQGTLVLADNQQYRDPQALLALMQQHAVDVVQATPSLWHLLVRLDWPVGFKPAVCISTGEALGKTLARSLYPHAGQLWNLYGPTECTLWTTAHAVDERDLADEAADTVSIGKVLPGYGALIAALPDGSAASREEPMEEPMDESIDELLIGELLIGGYGVGSGYLDATLTAERFISDGAGTPFYRSGDYCALDANGNLHFLKRLDNQVKLNGYRIELDEISRCLERHESIQQAVCLLKPLHHENHGSQLLAFIVCEPGTPHKNPEDFTAHLAALLPAWMLPQRYFHLSEMPMTASGKLDRNALLAIAANDISTDEILLTGLSGEVAAIFCEVLEVPSIGPDDSFFEAGGNSMLSAALVLTLNQRFSSNITLRTALETPPTVNSLTSLLQAAGVQDQ
jgi:amino acid adenylation domain-containing protein